MCVRWPVREGMKTIRQIADEIGVSKQAVYKRYKGKLYTVCAPYAHTEQGVLYLSEQAETLIKQDFLRDGCPNGNWRMVAEGTRMTQDFASFLKELY